VGSRDRSQQPYCNYNQVRKRCNRSGQRSSGIHMAQRPRSPPAVACVHMPQCIRVPRADTVHMCLWKHQHKSKQPDSAALGRGQSNQQAPPGELGSANVGMLRRQLQHKAPYKKAPQCQPNVPCYYCGRHARVTAKSIISCCRSTAACRGRVVIVVAPKRPSASPVGRAPPARHYQHIANHS
jgi:hypothetical protein